MTNTLREAVALRIGEAEYPTDEDRKGISDVFMTSEFLDHADAAIATIRDYLVAMAMERAEYLSQNRYDIPDMGWRRAAAEEVSMREAAEWLRAQLATEDDR